MSKKTELPKKKRESKKFQRIILRGESCSPGVHLIEAIAEYDPDYDALAILAAWTPHLCIEVKHA